MNPWISAAIAAGGGLVLGAVLARLVRALLLRTHKEALVTAAPPLASLVFSTLLIVGLVVALGFVHPESRDKVINDMVAFLPRTLAAAIVVIGGNVVATLARTAVAKALRGQGSAERYGPGIVKFAIMAFAAILGAAQLGVDTTIINILTASVLFGTAAAAALLVGLGGRTVAAEVAAGRAWRNSLTAGDRVVARDVGGADIDGTVVEIHPTAVELVADGKTVLVPNSRLLDVVVEVTKATVAPGA
ncbi:MAG TPA: hypothetical protein VNQ73_17810 [Ilumatobacter sp.]|nr:hypothetical protein [Ilumatobacter sp.]